MSGLIALASVRLAAAGVESPRSEARILLAHVLGGDRSQTLNVETLPPNLQAAFEEAITRRAAREPLAYITGAREFWSLDFSVGPGVLVPRPDSETLIEAALAEFPNRDAPLAIADLGTGSGALLIAALKEFPNATGLGLERSPDALHFARINALRHGLANRCEVRLADWNSAPQGAFDLVFCNPPYIPAAHIAGLEPEVRREPHAALDGGPDGLDAYRALAGLIPGLLKPGGRAVLELGIGQASSMELVFANMQILQIIPDLAGIPRALVLASAK